MPMTPARRTSFVLAGAGLLILGILHVTSKPLLAKTLYVNRDTGNDTTSYEQNGPDYPWQTIGRAAWGSTDRSAPKADEAARAGDEVVVAPGTYAVAGTNSRNVPAYNPVNQGEPGRPITFRAAGVVRLVLSSSSGTVIGSFDKDFIVWDGFTIDEASAPSNSDTGPVTIWACRGCEIWNCDINGAGDAQGRRDNHTGIRIEGSQQILIQNNRIRNVYTAHNVNNGAGIQTYSAGAVTIEHNEIFSSGSGVFIKGGGAPGVRSDFLTIRHNLIYDIGDAQGGSGIILHVGAGNKPETPATVYQNVVRNAREAGIKIWMLDGIDPARNPNNSRIVNNTIVGARFGIWITADLMENAGHVVRNNIISGADLAFNYEAMASNAVKSRFDSEHNVFFPSSQIALGGARISLDTWKSRFAQDSVSPASSTRNPGFVDEARFDYRLRQDSRVREAGVDVLDLDGDGRNDDLVPAGAYITGTETIGRRSSAPDQ